MKPTKTLRFALVISGLTAIGIGASILFAPVQFHATYGIDLGVDASSMSEIRAPGGALMVLGSMMLVGVFVKPFTFVSTLIAAAVYLGYGVARLVSIGLDGVPDPGLVWAAGIELVIGVACVALLLRSMIQTSGAVSSPARSGSGERAGERA